MKKIFYLIPFIFTMSVSSAQQRPNIVLIISDDHAFQAIGAYNNKVTTTPNIDRIANEGAVFKRAYVTNSICGPSRATLLTGKYSHKNGFKDNETSTFDHNQDLFVKRLRVAGYQTAWIGKQHLGNKPQGFDYYSILPDQGQYYNPDFINSDGETEHIEGYVTNIITDKAEKWLDERDPEKPFCLIIGHKATHRTWIPDTADFGMFDNKTFPLPANFYDTYEGRKAAGLQEMSIGKDLKMGYDLKMLTKLDIENESTVKRMNSAQRSKFDAYYGQIYKSFQQQLSGKALAEWKYQRYMRDYMSTAASMDRNIGRVLDYLDRFGLTKSTLVIYLSDQGFYMGEHGWFDKRFMYEESFRTPMVVRYPALIKPKSKIDAFVTNTDIAPTLLQLADVSIPADIQGQSIVPLLDGSKKTIHKEVYYHYYENGEHAVSPHFGVTNGRYKLIRFYKRVEGWELFDLEKDPNEMHNLFGTAEYKNVMQEMKQLLIEQINKYDDQEAKRIVLISR